MSDAKVAQRKKFLVIAVEWRGRIISAIYQRGTKYACVRAYVYLHCILCVFLVSYISSFAALDAK